MTTSSVKQTTADDWHHLDAQAPVPIEGDVTVPLEMWRENREALSWRDGRTGVRLGPRDRVDAIAADLPRLALVVLETADARPDARRAEALRQHAFRGEIRCAGRAVPAARLRAPRGSRPRPLTPGSVSGARAGGPGRIGV